jgi:ribonucleoside-diphosphate reductase alpha chain
VKVKKRNGRLENFNVDKINECAERASKNLDNVSASEVLIDAKIKLYDKVTTTEIDKSLIMSARSKIEFEPNYAYMAARMLLNTIYKEVFGEGVDSDAFELQYRKSFITNMRRLVREEILNEELLESFDLRELSAKLNIEREKDWKYLGIQTIYDRYLLHIEGRRMETPQAMWMRIAMGLALNEKPEDRQAYALKFYETLSCFDVVSSTPTLFNSGTTHSQLSSCYLNTFDDSIDGIFDGIWQEARKSKFAGGLGFDITNFRARGSYIKGTNGINQGPVYFWKLYNDMLVAVNQGGKRKGAGCAYLETWHSDIEDFLALRKSVGDDRMRCHDMNTANWIPDLFMKQVEADGPWYLFSPNEVPELHEIFGEAFETKYWEYVKKGQDGELNVFRELKAKDLWKKMLKSIFETGHPWVTFKDPSNIRYSNQHVGTVHSSNLCTEILLHTKPTIHADDGTRTVKEYGETATCNLASINLKRHVGQNKHGEKFIDYDKLEKSTKMAMRMLDNVIDLNYYPTEEARKSNMTHRPVGLGTMGWHDMFYEFNVNYGSDDAIRISDEIYENISYFAIESSSDMAVEKETYESYTGSLWSKGTFPIDTWKEVMKLRGNSDEVNLRKNWDELKKKVAKQGMRNSNTMAIAPTATISYIAGCSQSIEPNFGVIFVYSTLSGEFTMMNEYFVNDMKSEGIWTKELANLVKTVDGDLGKLNGSIPQWIKEKYVTAFQQDQFKLIDCAAARQKWIDQGQSLNLYNDKSSMKFLNDVYTHAWKSGLKTTYYLRNLAASAIEKSTGSNVEEHNADNPDTENPPESTEPSLCSLEAKMRGEICESCQ